MTKEAGKRLSFTWRVSGALMRRLEREAQKHGWSVNNEVTRRIERSFAADAQAVRDEQMVIAVKEALEPTIREQVKSTIKELYQLPGEDDESK